MTIKELSDKVVDIVKKNYNFEYSKFYIQNEIWFDSRTQKYDRGAELTIHFYDTKYKNEHIEFNFRQYKTPEALIINLKLELESLDAKKADLEL